jgi:hypothetical protein
VVEAVTVWLDPTRFVAVVGDRARVRPVRMLLSIARSEISSFANQPYRFPPTTPNGGVGVQGEKQSPVVIVQWPPGTTVPLPSGKISKSTARDPAFRKVCRNVYQPDVVIRAGVRHPGPGEHVG